MQPFPSWVYMGDKVNSGLAECRPGSASHIAATREAIRLTILLFVGAD
jgi:hypothetical protein